MLLRKGENSLEFGVLIHKLIYVVANSLFYITLRENLQRVAQQQQQKNPVCSTKIESLYWSSCYAIYVCGNNVNFIYSISFNHTIPNQKMPWRRRISTTTQNRTTKKYTIIVILRLHLQRSVVELFAFCFLLRVIIHIFQ